MAQRDEWVSVAPKFILQLENKIALTQTRFMREARSAIGREDTLERALLVAKGEASEAEESSLIQLLQVNASYFSQLSSR